jgi:carbonic anhydrase/acetyltransferase-like protein (isoleucine patch superfamily)
VNIQDGSILHADPGFPAVLGDRVTLGHGAMVHGAVVEPDTLIGIRATVLNGCRIGRGSIVAAGAVLRPGTEVPPGSLVVGVPGKVRREVTEEDTAMIAHTWRVYVRKARTHRQVQG